MFDKVTHLKHYCLLPVTVTVMLCIGCSFPGFKESAQVISMNDLPQAVRPLAEKETAGYRIIEIEKEMKNGDIIYAITYDQDGTEMEIEYGTDGKLMSKGKE
jgi:hypothetical protein